MSYDNPTDWAAVFKKRNHQFTEDEIHDSQMSDLMPLSQLLPEFHQEYVNCGRNSKAMEDIWELEYEWLESVGNQEFLRAKVLYNRLKKVKMP